MLAAKALPATYPLPRCVEGCGGLSASLWGGVGGEWRLGLQTDRLAGEQSQFDCEYRLHAKVTHSCPKRLHKNKIKTHNLLILLEFFL